MAKITLVDDDENIVTSVSLALESHGHTVKAYYDGASGLAALENEPPDLAILDVKMPQLNGIEVCMRMKRISRLRDVPVVMLTALRDEETRTQLKAAQADAIIYKPLEGKDFRETVKSLLARGAKADGQPVSGDAGR